MRAFAILVLWTAAPAAAQSLQVGWEDLQRQLKKNAGLAAHEIAVRAEMPDDSGQRVYQYQAHLQSWDAKGNPIWGLEGDYSMAKLDLSLAEHVANRPDTLFEPPAFIQALPDQSIDGQACAVYELKSTFANGTRPVAARFWIVRQTGRLEKVEGTMEKVGLPGVKSANFSLHYAADSAGRSLPQKLSVQYTISVFFHSGTVTFVQQFAEWRPKPP